MEDLKIDVKKAIGPEIIEKNGIIYRDGVAQVNDDGSRITDERYYKTADGYCIPYKNNCLKVLDHTPTKQELTIANLKENPENKKKGNETRRNRKTAQDSLKFLLSCAAEPKEARELIRTLTGGEMSDTMRNFFEPPEGEENNLTQYDLINLAMITAAKNGDTKAANYVRDTIGDKLAEKQEISATFTDGDKSLLEKVSARLQALSVEYLTIDQE